MQTESKLWLPEPLVSGPVQREQRRWLPPFLRRASGKSKHQGIWVPSLSAKSQKQAVHQGTSSSFKTYFKVGISGKTSWDWMMLLLQLVTVLIVAVAILVGMSRFAAQQALQENLLMQQLSGEQDKLAYQLLTGENGQSMQQLMRAQNKVAQQLLQSQNKLVQQQTGLVDEGHAQILSNYLNTMSTLLSSQASTLKQGGSGSWSRIVAQTQTNAALTALKSDGPRKSIVIQFLYDAGLISSGKHHPGGPIIQLSGLDLSGMTFKQANLSSANFDGAILNGVNFSNGALQDCSFRGAILVKANFSAADLENANFNGANLENANLNAAHLTGTNLNGADLKGANVNGATW